MTRQAGGAVAIATAVWLSMAAAGCGSGGDTASTRPSGGAFAMLDPYGEWIDVPVRGHVWRPVAAYDWQPYADGQWVWSDRGWVWVTDEPYGWVVYHYGFWTNEPGPGWVWTPGYDWSPARVRWIVTDDYCGWAPLPAPGVVLVDPERDVQLQVWSMVSKRDFTRESIGRYRLRSLSPVMAGNLPAGVRRAPDVRDIESTNRQRVPVARLSTEAVPAGQRQLVRLHVAREAGVPRTIDEAPAVQPPALQPPAVQPPAITPPVRRDPGVELLPKVKKQTPAVKNPPKKAKEEPRKTQKKVTKEEGVK
jgi:hypothetical protein